MLGVDSVRSTSARSRPVSPTPACESWSAGSFFLRGEVSPSSAACLRLDAAARPPSTMVARGPHTPPVPSAGAISSAVPARGLFPAPQQKDPLVPLEVRPREESRRESCERCALSPTRPRRAVEVAPSFRGEANLEAASRDGRACGAQLELRHDHHQHRLTWLCPRRCEFSHCTAVSAPSRALPVARQQSEKAIRLRQRWRSLETGPRRRAN